MKKIINNTSNIIILLAFIAMMTGCYTEQVATKQTTKAQANYPGTVAELCSIWYPVQTYTKTKIEYKPGEPIPYKVIDTVTIDCDSAVAAAKKNGTSAKNTKAPCPPCDSLRVDTVLHLQSILAESTSKLVAAQAETKAVEKDYNTALQYIATLKQKLRTVNWVMWVLVVYTGVRWLLTLISKGRFKLP